MAARTERPFSESCAEPPRGARTETARALLLVTFVAIVVKVAQVSNRPNFAFSVGPLTTVSPRVPITFALTTRGEEPRRVTWTRLKRPFTSPPSLRSTSAEEKRYGPQRCFGEASS